MVILLQEKNFGPNVIYYVSTFIDMPSECMLKARLAKPEFQIFQNALNRVLTLPDCRSRRQLSESGFRSQEGPLGVEL